MRPPHRITLVSGQLGIGGQERGLYLLLRELDRTRFEPEVVSLNAGGYWANEIRTLGIPVLELPRRRHWEVERLLGLLAYLRERRPALLYSLGLAANSYGRIAGRLAGIPRMVVSWLGLEASPLHCILERLLATSTDRVVCNSQAVRRDVLANYPIPEERVTVIPNGVEPVAGPDPAERTALRAEMGAGPLDLLVGSVARLAEDKNPALFMEVAAQVRALRPRMRFCVVGGGPLRPLVEAQVAALGVGPVLRLLGERPDARRLCACFDVFLLTSHREGMPNAVLEAMAAGVACVVTAVGGSTEVVQDGETGFLVPPGDAQAMTARVLELANDRDRLAQMGARGQERARRDFSVERMVRDHEALFGELIGASPDHGRPV